MSIVSTIHNNPGGVTVVQAQPHANGARVSDTFSGRYIDVRYDDASGEFIIEAESSNIHVETGSNKIWVSYK